MLGQRNIKLHTYCLFEPSFYGRFFPNICTLNMAQFKPLSCVLYRPFTLFSPFASACDSPGTQPQQIHYCDSEYTAVLLPGKVRFHPAAGHTGPEGSRGIALLFHDHGTRWGWVVNVTPRPPLPPGKTRYPLYRRLGAPQNRSG
jgi:hypothetical protein